MLFKIILCCFLATIGFYVVEDAKRKTNFLEDIPIFRCLEFIIGSILVFSPILIAVIL